MNETSLRDLVRLARDDLSTQPKAELKRMRKKLRQMVLRDLQRRAITGEPSLFKRGDV